MNWIKFLFLICFCFCKAESSDLETQTFWYKDTISKFEERNKRHAKYAKKRKLKKIKRGKHKQRIKKININNRRKKRRNIKRKRDKLKQQRKKKKHIRRRAKVKHRRTKKRIIRRKKGRSSKQQRKKKRRKFPYKLRSWDKAFNTIIKDACNKLDQHYKSISRIHLEKVVRQYLTNNLNQYIRYRRYKKLGNTAEGIARVVPIRKAAEIEFSSYPYEDKEKIIDYAIAHPSYNKDEIFASVPQNFGLYKVRFENNVRTARNYKQLICTINDFVRVNSTPVYDGNPVFIPAKIANVITHTLLRSNLYTNIDNATADDLTGSPLLSQRIEAITQFSKIVSTLGHLITSFQRYNTSNTGKPNLINVERNIKIALDKFANAAKKLIDKALAESRANVKGGENEIYTINFDEINPHNDSFGNYLNRSTSLAQTSNEAYRRLHRIANLSPDSLEINSLNTGQVDLTNVSRETIIQYAKELKGFIKSSNSEFNDKVREMLTISPNFNVQISTNTNLRSNLIEPIEDAMLRRGPFSTESLETGGVYRARSVTTHDNIRNSIVNMKRRHPNWSADSLNVVQRLKHEIQTNHANNRKTQIALQVLDAIAGDTCNNNRNFSAPLLSLYAMRCDYYDNTTLKELISLIWNEIKRVPDQREQSYFIETLIDRLFEIRFANGSIPNEIVSIDGYQVNYLGGFVDPHTSWSCLGGVVERLIGMFDFSSFHNDVYVHDRLDFLSSRPVSWGDFNFQIGRDIDHHIMKLFELVSISMPNSFVSLGHNKALYRRLAFWRMAKWFKALTAATNGQIELLNDLRLRLLVFAEGTQTVIGDQIFD